MLDIIIIILLLSGLFIGLKRGFIRQFIRLVTFIAAIAVAATYYGDLAPKLGWIPSPDFTGGQSALAFVNGSLEGAYYNMIAFFDSLFPDDYPFENCRIVSGCRCKHTGSQTDQPSTWSRARFCGNLSVRVCRSVHRNASADRCSAKHDGRFGDG